LGDKSVIQKDDSGERVSWFGEASSLTLWQQTYQILSSINEDAPPAMDALQFEATSCRYYSRPS
jgi:hypothetical protein